MTRPSGAPGSARATVRIGLTGPIGCGKSTIARWLGGEGAAVIDADAVARDVTAPGSATLAAVLGAFGPAVQLPDGALDRAALAGIVFGDPSALARLEAITHPAVRARILASIDAAAAAGRPAVVIEAIKLVEGGLAELCDAVWLVRCDPADARRRLAGRGLAPADVERRMAAQDGLEARVAPVASWIVDTSGDPDRTRADAVAAYRQLLGSRGPGG